MRWARPVSRRILVVEPDETTLSTVTEALGWASEVLTARTSAEAEAQLAKAEPSLVLVGLPIDNGLELCHLIRAGSATPIVFLAGFDPDDEALPSYTAGADGYIRKPYRLHELDARIRAALRHAQALDQSGRRAITVDDVTVDLDSHEVRVRGSVVRLPLREFQLLSVLLAHPGKVWTREALMRRIWGETPASGTK